MPQSTPLSILVVDDHKAVREAIATGLTRRGCRVTTAASGIEGLQAVRGQPFDIVITDIHMPEHGGLWLYQRAVAQRPELRGRFLLCGSEPPPELGTISIVAASEHFLPKPFALDTLWQLVQEVAQGEGSE